MYRLFPAASGMDHSDLRRRGVWLAVGLAVAMVTGAVAPVAAAGAQQQPDPDRTANGERVIVTVTMEGQPTDAQIVVRDPSGSVVAVQYTDVHNPGRAAFELTPGEYEFEIDKGGGYVTEKVYRDVTVTGEEFVDVDIERRYAPNDRGYYGADLHAHSIHSADTNDSPMDEFVGAQLAADLDVLFISDHNTVQGHTPFRRHAEERNTPYLLSDELSTDVDLDMALDQGQRVDPTNSTSGGNYGHFNVYPVPENRNINWMGDPDDFFGAARAAGAEIIQANHPERDSNYFHHVDTPEYNESYETVEVFNDAYSSDEDETIAQLYELWNEGHRYTAVGVSDDHESGDVGDEYGNPRTYVYMDREPDGVAREFARSLDDQHAFATYGPLVFLETQGGAIPGAEVEEVAPDGNVTLTAEIRNIGELDRVQLVRNGTVVRNETLDGETADLEYEVDANGTSWFVMRVQDEAGAIGTHAITNPIWVSETGFGPNAGDTTQHHVQNPGPEEPLAGLGVTTSLRATFAMFQRLEFEPTHEMLHSHGPSPGESTNATAPQRVTGQAGSTPDLGPVPDSGTVEPTPDTAPSESLRAGFAAIAEREEL
jgi:hypothetical protein